MARQIEYRMWELRREDLRDRSVMSLLIVNLTVIAWALYERWDPYILMWVHWGQSIVIGIVWFVRVLLFTHLYSKNYLDSSGSPIRIGPLLRLGLGFFF